MDLRNYGYAEGAYRCICSQCGFTFTGDKRSSTCKDCILEYLLIKNEKLTQEKELLKEYIELLKDEINDMFGIAYTHGFKSIRVEKGFELRKRLEELGIEVSKE